MVFTFRTTSFTLEVFGEERAYKYVSLQSPLYRNRPKRSLNYAPPPSPTTAATENALQSTKNNYSKSHMRARLLCIIKCVASTLARTTSPLSHRNNKRDIVAAGESIKNSTRSRFLLFHTNNIIFYFFIIIYLFFLQQPGSCEFDNKSKPINVFVPPHTHTYTHSTYEESMICAGVSWTGRGGGVKNSYYSIGKIFLGCIKRTKPHITR